LNWIGKHEFPGCQYIGIKRDCSIKEMPKLMQKDFDDLMTYAENVEGSDASKSFSMYHKWDFVKGRASYTAGVPTNHIPADLPKRYISGEIPKTTVYTLEHQGPYEHLGNAWTTMHSMIRNKEIKVNKSISPFETYGNDPNNTDPKDLITHINFAVKS